MSKVTPPGGFRSEGLRPRVRRPPHSDPTALESLPDRRPPAAGSPEVGTSVAQGEPLQGCEFYPPAIAERAVNFATLVRFKSVSRLAYA